MSKNPLEGLPGALGNNLGDYLREQRLLAKLSVRQLSALAGVSNPYLSQIERGVKRPSAEILQQIARGLSISAETLYVQAGLLDPKDAAAEAGATTRAAIRTDPALTARQRQTLLEIYESFVGAGAAALDPAEPSRPTPRSRATHKAARQAKGATPAPAQKKAASPARGKAAGTKGSTTTSRSKTSAAKKSAGRSTTTSSRTSTTRRTS
ncbi:helix-turn-helix domain-containing protein [Janibacter terrae]|jgi:transcriptional regulator with XRE-family HTH domain|uniref:Helix-turn-helix domain-containing protein n=1 Tax=Janibacter terrae TaxID=103817 RepID=A0ABZ2FJ00_9MICO|nr:helix-turn-helix transcriptional regulator [Janibacter terrae]MBA4085007.1 helix-turn-helix domain-containing protein [Kytococcus sp.]HBO54830.1 helix-turn-helix domain-containing protein [Janibacter terrae]HCE60040.1 helix-turn-helix domain-containing protein [Janibacter terrae]